MAAPRWGVVGCSFCHRHRRGPEPTDSPGGGDGEGSGTREFDGAPPAVLAHLPVFHVRQVVTRLIGAVATLEPATASSVQMLDDSTDDTGGVAPAGLGSGLGSRRAERPGGRAPARTRPATTDAEAAPVVGPLPTPTSGPGRISRRVGARAARRPGSRHGTGAPGAPDLTAPRSPRRRDPARWAALISAAGAEPGYAVRQGSYPIRHRPGREGCLASPR